LIQTTVLSGYLSPEITLKSDTDILAPASGDTSHLIKFPFQKKKLFHISRN